MEKNCKDGKCDVHNQTPLKFIPDNGNKIGICFFIKKVSDNPSKFEKIKIEDITYDDSLKMSSDYKSFKWLPYGSEITLPDGSKSICKAGMFY